MDLGFRPPTVNKVTLHTVVSILGLMDLGFRPIKVDSVVAFNLCFNPWFNGFRF